MRVRNGIYKGDLGQVLEVDLTANKATVRFVPRLDYVHISQRQAKFAGEDIEVSRSRKMRPAARPFSKEEARESGVGDIEERHNEVGGFDVLIHVGSAVVARIRNGYHLKECSLKSLRVEKNPLLDEIQRFNQVTDESPLLN